MLHSLGGLLAGGAVYLSLCACSHLRVPLQPSTAKVRRVGSPAVGLSRVRVWCVAKLVWQDPEWGRLVGSICDRICGGI